MAGRLPWAAAVLLAAGFLRAGEEAPPATPAPTAPASLEERTAPLRQALYYDPTLEAPLQRLVELYRQEGRGEEAVQLYRRHLAAYPGDTGALVVLVRLLAATGDPGAEAAARGAAEANPQHDYLQYLLYEARRANHNPQALAALDRAIELCPDSARRRRWIERLVPEAFLAGRRELAEKHLRGLLALAGDNPELLLAAAGQLVDRGFPAPALEALARLAAAGELAPETMVEAELAAAHAEVALGRLPEARARLDALLGRLAADYWRRGEIVRRRAALARSAAEREALVAEARRRLAAHPADEAAALDLAGLLADFDRRREALETLVAAGGRLPDSLRLEQEALALFDRLRDDRGRERFLAERLRRDPARRDLALARAHTLFLLGREGEGRQQLVELTAGLGPDERALRLVESARFLRRAGRPRIAVDLFRLVLDEDGARLDVRLELAETLLAAGRRGEARALFASPPAAAVPEQVLEAGEFLLRQQLAYEARLLLARRAAQDRGALDVRLLLARALARLGARAAGETALAEARALADTPSRYRQWLETALAFAERFEASEDFLREEAARLEADQGLAPDRLIGRRLAYAELAGRAGRREEVLPLLLAQVENEALPVEVRREVRRRLIGLIGHQESDQAELFEAQVRELAREDPAARLECNARLALLRQAAGRPDEARALLEGLKPAELADAALVRDLLDLVRQLDQPELEEGLLGRLTQLEPDNRDHWERWLAALAAGDQEDRLRLALRRLLAGVERLPLAPETRELLGRHLVDSYWRSLGERLAAAGEKGESEGVADLEEALVLLGDVEPLDHGRNHGLWTTWLRAWLLERLGRRPERDEALAELDRLAREPEAPPAASPSPRPTPTAGAIAAGSPGASAAASPTPSPLPGGAIRFPDGLLASLPRVRQLIAARGSGAAGGIPGGEGPQPPLALAWTFESAAPLTSLLAAELEGRALLFAGRADGRLELIDRATGRLLGELECAPADPGQAPLFAGGRLFFAVAGAVECRAAAGGRLLWRAAVGAEGETALLAAGEGGVLAFAPESGEAVALAAETGKARWWTVLPAGAEAGRLPPARGAGISCAGGQVLVFGKQTAILDAQDGAILWVFAPGELRALPPDLRPPQEEGFLSSLNPTPAPGAGSAAAFAAGFNAAFAYGGPYGLPPGYVGYPGSYAAIIASGGYAGPVGYPGAGYAPAAAPSFLAASHASPRARALLRQRRWGQPPAALVSPLVAWGRGEEGEATARRAALHAGRLLLLDGAGAVVAPLDVPLAARQYAGLRGELLGFAGRRACLRQGWLLTLLDLARGEPERLDLRRVAGLSPRPGPVWTAVSGPAVYALGAGGVLALEARSGAILFEEPLPAGLAALLAPEEEPGAQEDDPEAQALAYWAARTGQQVELPARALLAGNCASLVAGDSFYFVVGAGRLIAVRGPAAATPAAATPAAATPAAATPAAAVPGPGAGGSQAP